MMLYIYPHLSTHWSDLIYIYIPVLYIYIYQDYIYIQHFIYTYYIVILSLSLQERFLHIIKLLFTLVTELIRTSILFISIYSPIYTSLHLLFSLYIVLFLNLYTHTLFTHTLTHTHLLHTYIDKDRTGHTTDIDKDKQQLI